MVRDAGGRGRACSAVPLPGDKSLPGTIHHRLLMGN